MALALRYVGPITWKRYSLTIEQAGDPSEVSGVSSVFAASRTADNPLIIGSVSSSKTLFNGVGGLIPEQVKSNIGHSEPAAGISGLLKAILTIEKGVIPGTPTFVTPNPKSECINDILVQNDHANIGSS